MILGDTHEQHREVDVPSGDILIFTGDLTMFSKHPQAIRDFDTWLGELPHRHKLIIPGNHDYFLEADAQDRTRLRNAKLLINTQVEIQGLRIYGSPTTPLYGGAFGLSSATDRARHWAMIPPDTHVLVTHGPPFGVLDKTPEDLDHLGDRELLQRIGQLEALRLHLFGHVHGAFGSIEKDGVTFLNTALMGPSGSLEHKPARIRLLPS